MFGMTSLPSMRRFLLVTPLALLACGDGTGPATVHGTYALRRVEGQLGPPFVTSDLSCAPGDRIVVEITGDTISLTAAGGVRHVSSHQTRVWSQGVEGTPLVAATLRTGSYRREGSVVIITALSAPQQPPPIDTLRLSTGGLERESALGAVCASGPTDARVGTFEYARL
jgi:hypothetical protein